VTGRITGADVAREVGVSAATVSLAFSTRPKDRGRVASTTREEIRRTAARLGYTPNHIASSLRRQHTGLLMMIVQTLANPYYTGVTEGAQQAAAARGYSLSVLEVGRSSISQPALTLLRGGAADGIILASHSDALQQEMLNLIRQGVAAVAIQGRELSRYVPTVAACGEEGSYRATRYLIGLGHRRIAHISADPSVWPNPGAGTLDLERRLHGYQRALAEAGIGCQPELISPGPDTMAGGAESTRRLLERPGPRPTAILAFNDVMAIGALRELSNQGVRVPEEMSVVGFDGIELGEYVIPRLTTLVDPFVEKGRRAAEILCDLVDGVRARRGEEEILPAELVRLVVRDSSGPPPA
jgi:DNA-binding LacI/PurR family transcriptional regulator